jgi:DNA-binding transcriptional ArsR family regulator
MTDTTSDPKITWDIGTAYDFFVSLYILHFPDDYGLRPAWASGMRQRLPARDREVLETFHEHLTVTIPLHWVHSLPDPKDSKTMLATAKALSPVDRICALIGLDEELPEAQEIIREVITSGEWDDEDVKELDAVYKKCYGESKGVRKLKKKFEYWPKAAEMSDDLLRALQTYYDVFFSDEEQRIEPAMEKGLAKAQEQAEKLPLPELLEELSQGVRYQEDSFQGHEELILAPSFWGSPFLFYTNREPLIFLFGARPATESLVPGELVPDTLLSSINALSDPTRLRILRYLSSESLTPTQLAKRLRLRTPTVLYHIKALRSAGLVYVIPGSSKKQMHYQTRIEKLEQACELLKGFIKEQEE